jgi:tRNA threonylcarbamoyladenosine biosynthesis protein TsaE
MKKKILIDKDVFDIDGTKEFTADAVKYFKSGDTILLYGDLGSGKTLITKYFVALLGSKAEVSSPTFTIINQYDGLPAVNHIDLYRLKDQMELINLGLEDLFDSPSINFIEWPEIIENRISWQHFRIRIATKPDVSEWRRFVLSKFYE